MIFSFSHILSKVHHKYKRRDSVSFHYISKISKHFARREMKNKIPKKKNNNKKL